MNRFCSLYFAVAIAGLLAPQTFSADGTKNGAIISSATGETLSIKVTGIYTVDSNYKLRGIKLMALPGPNGGEGGIQDVKGQKGSFKGTISVPAGTYEVQVLLIVTDNCGKESYYYSETSRNITAKEGK